MGGGGDDRVVAKLPGVDGLHGQKQRHDLGDAGGLQLGVGVFFVENGARFLFHQHRRGRRDLQGAGAGAEQRRRAQGRQKSLHVHSPLQQWYSVCAGRGVHAAIFRVAFSGKVCYNTTQARGYSSSVERQLPKLHRWVRLPSAAPKENATCFDKSHFLLGFAPVGRSTLQ